MLVSLIPSYPSAVAPNTNTFAVFGIPSACILLAMLMLETGDYRVRSPLLLSLGDASYSIYLSHYFIIGFFVAVNKQIHQPPLLMSILAFLVVCAAGVIIFRAIERPLVLPTKKALSAEKPFVYQLRKHALRHPRQSP